MIKEATLNDIKEVLDVLDHFQKHNKRLITLSRVFLLELVVKYLQSPSSTFLLSKNGFASATMDTYPYNGEKVSYLRLWYLKEKAPKEAFELFKAFEEWSKKMGAKYIVVTEPAEEKLAHIYERKGYKKLETHYLKEVK